MTPTIIRKAVLNVSARCNWYAPYERFRTIVARARRDGTEEEGAKPPPDCDESFIADIERSEEWGELLAGTEVEVTSQTDGDETLCVLRDGREVYINSQYLN